MSLIDSRRTRSLPRLDEFINGQFRNKDFEIVHMKRIAISKDGEIILDVIRPDIPTIWYWELISSCIPIQKRRYTKDGYLPNGYIARILNEMAFTDIGEVLIEIVIEDSVGRSADLFVTRVLRYVVTYHDHLCDCRCISDPRLLENLGIVMEVMGE